MKIKEGDQLPVSQFYYLDKDSAVQKVDTILYLKTRK